MQELKEKHSGCLENNVNNYKVFSLMLFIVGREFRIFALSCALESGHPLITNIAICYRGAQCVLGMMHKCNA